MDDTTKCEWDPALHHGEKCPHHEGGGGSSDLAGPKETVFGDSIDDFLSSFNPDDIDSFLSVAEEVGIDIEAIDFSDYISLKNFQKAREKMISKDKRDESELFSDKEMEEINASVLKLFDRSHVGAFVKYNKEIKGKQTNIVLKILEDDEIKNQFQTGVSGGCYNHDVRAAASEWLFGSEEVTHGPDRYINRFQLEKYGCMIDGDLTKISKYQEAASQYGNCYFIFNEQTRKRITFTPDDSLGVTGGFLYRKMPSLLTEGIHKRQIKTANDFVKKNIINAKSISELGDAITDGFSSYLEIQAHGKMQPSKDVSAIFMPKYIFDSTNSSDVEASKKILKLATEKGIDILTSKSVYGENRLCRVVLNDLGSFEYFTDNVEKYNRHLK